MSSLFDDNNEFGSSFTNEAAWGLMGVDNTSSSITASNNKDQPDVNPDSLHMIYEDDDKNVDNDNNGGFFKGEDSSNVDNAFVTPSIGSVDALPLEQSVNNDKQSPSTSSRSSRRASIESLPSAALREWEKRHEEELEQKRRAEEDLASKKKEEARRQLSDWYKEREGRVQSIRKQNHDNSIQEEKKRRQVVQFPSNSGASWSRICELVDTPLPDSGPSSTSGLLSSKLKNEPNSKGKGAQGSVALNATSCSPVMPKNSPSETRDTSRMRQLLLQLRTTNNQQSSHPVLNGSPVPF